MDQSGREEKSWSLSNNNTTTSRQKLKWPIYDVQFKIRVDDLAPQTMKCPNHFALDQYTYQCESNEIYYIFDKGKEPSFINGVFEAYVAGELVLQFHFAWNDMWRPEGGRSTCCFGEKPSWAEKLSLSHLSEEDMETRVYLNVNHDRELRYIAIFNISFVFPHDFASD